MLQLAKPGDTIEIVGKYGIRNFETVDRVTKVHVITAHQKYRIKDGRLAGAPD